MWNVFSGNTLDWYSNIWSWILRRSYWVLYDMVEYQAHYGDVIMGAIASQITNLTIVYSTVYSGADQRKHQSSASLAFMRWIHRGPVNSPHKWPVTRKMFPFGDVIMIYMIYKCCFMGMYAINQVKFLISAFHILPILFCPISPYILIPHPAHICVLWQTPHCATCFEYKPLWLRALGNNGSGSNGTIFAMG